MKQSKDVTLGSGELCDHFSLFFYLFFFFTFYRINDSLIIAGWSLCWMCVVKSTDFILTQRITLNNIMRRIFWFFLFVCLFGSVKEVIQILTLRRPLTRQKCQKIDVIFREQNGVRIRWKVSGVCLHSVSICVFRVLREARCSPE